MNAAFALVDTPIGRCGVAWGEQGLLALNLPEAAETATRARLAARFPEAEETKPPPLVRKSVAAIVALLSGKGGDLTEVPLDMRGVPTFHRRVYEVARGIPPGATLSYGEVANRVGSPGAARAVGQALGRNPFAIIVPCHRVLAAGGKAGGFSASGGVVTKKRLLHLERPAALGPLFDSPGKGGFPFDPAAAVAHLRAADPKLAKLIDRVGPFRMELKTSSSLFEVLAESIVYQQLHGKAAATIHGRLCGLFRDGVLTPEGILSRKEETLRGVGLSAAKLRALQDLATKAATLPTLAEARVLADDALVERLTSVRGIGRWTVEMVLMFRLGRPDVLPVGDFGVRRGFGLTFARGAMPEPAAVAKRGARWAPYRSVASWYLWRATELAAPAPS